MFFKPIFKILLAVSLAGAAATAAPAEEKAPAQGDLPISYGKCYKIQSAERQFLRGTETVWNYQLFDSLAQADIYKVCQERVDGACNYAAERAVNSGEDFFLWDFVGTRGEDQHQNLLASNNPGYFYPGYGWYKDFFRFNGEVDSNFKTEPRAIRTGGTNDRQANGIMESSVYLTSTRDKSTRLLWYHEVECPE